MIVWGFFCFVLFFNNVSIYLCVTLTIIVYNEHILILLFLLSHRSLEDINAEVC